MNVSEPCSVCVCLGDVRPERIQKVASPSDHLIRCDSLSPKKVCAVRTYAPGCFGLSHRAADGGSGTLFLHLCLSIAGFMTTFNVFNTIYSLALGNRYPAHRGKNNHFSCWAQCQDAANINMQFHISVMQLFSPGVIRSLLPSHQTLCGGLRY